MGATWSDQITVQNFSIYARKHGAVGMMATTWHYVQTQDWNTVEKLIDTSGKFFLEDFVDVK